MIKVLFARDCFNKMLEFKGESYKCKIVKELG